MKVYAYGYDFQILEQACYSCYNFKKCKLAPWKKSYDQTRQLIKKQRHYFANKDPYGQSYGFPVVMYRCES